MLNFQLTDRAALRLFEERDAPELYAVVERNRAYLARWMPWAADQTEEKTLEFIRLTRRDLADNKGLGTAITVEGAIAGSIGTFDVDWDDRSARIGYWLAEPHQGAGIVTAAVRAHLDYGFDVLDLHRLELGAGVDNARSRAVAGRLGFTEEGVLRASERIGERFQDVVVYSMLAPEWRARRP